MKQIMLLLSVLSWPGLINAQGVPLHSLAIPGTTFTICTSVPAKVEDSAPFVYLIVDESKNFETRELRVSFDSLGAPVRLTTYATKKIADSLHVEHYGVAFNSAETSIHFVAAVPNALLTQPNLTIRKFQAGSRQITRIDPIDLDRARTLANWIWRTKCKVGRIDM
jgi:hypothetical protein